MVSTGRGGSGNIVSPEEVGVDKPANAHEKSDKKIYYSTGRGGSGNIKSSNERPTPKLVPPGSNTPKLTTSKITTGRGGYGNMVDNSDPNLTRKLQDVDGRKMENDLYAVASNKSFSIGRGGFGNVVSKTRSNGSSRGLDPNNLYTVVSHGEKKGSKKEGFMLKVKGFCS